MSEPPETTDATPQIPSFYQIDEACHRFAAEWEKGGSAQIEDYIEGWNEPERSKLLYELLSIEIDHRKRRGEAPSLEQQEVRFSATRNVVREVFERAGNDTDTSAPKPMEETLAISSELANIRYHAEGGLGIVYAAEDSRLKRNLAVKFIHHRVAADAASRARFLLEAEVTSRLEHPGVVPVHGLGQTGDNRPFYAMRLIEGETLDAAIDRFHRQADTDPDRTHRELRFRELLDRFVAVCKTIAFAHNRGIVHRDIKPVNIMLGRYGETIVVDWGLALPVARQGIFKESGERTLMPSLESDSQRVVAGTPAFMSPEQASGSLDLSPASDIYSLGATLYKIVTGSVPFHGQDCLNQVIRGEFPRPTQANRHTSKPLEAICLKAMARSPEDRYATGLELANDIENYLADVPVSAYQESLARKLARWMRRHRTTGLGLASGLIVLTVAAILATAWMGRQAHRESELRTVAERAQQSEHELRKQGLQVSAEFAARMLANQIDIRWRVLEKEAADPALHDALRTLNATPLDEAHWEPLQSWLDTRRVQCHPDVTCRAWFVQTRQGIQVARSPSRQPSGQRFGSLGANYAFRDYFHGGGRDYYQDRQFSRRPLRSVHNSTAMESTNQGDLTVVFSVPIVTPASTEPLGVLGISLELGRFADLRVPLPSGQKVLLVETRTYYLLRKYPHDHEERGEGLVLHHEDFRDLKQQESLPHVDDQVVRLLRRGTASWQQPGSTGAHDNLLPPSYQDPVAQVEDGHWIAAFAPVLVTARPAAERDTGWCVIVQQRQ